MRNASVSISQQSLAPATRVTPSTAARTKLLLDGPILTTLLRLAAPNILNLLAFAGVITFDGFFLGRIGTNALAGASLAFPWVMMVLQTTNSGMGLGVSSAIARALGAGRRDRADALVWRYTGSISASSDCLPRSPRASAFTRRYWSTQCRASVLVDARAAAGLKQRLRNAVSIPLLEASKESKNASSHA